MSIWQYLTCILNVFNVRFVIEKNARSDFEDLQHGGSSFTSKTLSRL